MTESDPISGTGSGPGEPGRAPNAVSGEATEAAGERTETALDPPPGPGVRPQGLVRWGVALLVVALMVGVVSVASALLVGGGGSSAVQGWLPDDTVAYLEIRADLPGDQRAKVGDLLARFPGFADQASLDRKIDEAIERILAGSGVGWTADIKPWFGGEVGLAVTAAAFDLAALPGGGSPPEGFDPGETPEDGALALVAVQDAAAAEAWVAEQLGGAQTTGTHAGGAITIVSGLARHNLAFAVRGSVLVLGPEKAVRASLDTAGASTIASSASFAAALDAAPSAYLGYGYVDMKAFVEGALDAAGEDAALPTACLDAIVEQAPTWAAGSVRAEDDALVFTATARMAVAAATTENSASASASRLPASTVAAIEVRDLGAGVVAGLEDLKTTFACDPSTAEAITQLEQALAAVGGAEALSGWAGDTAVAVTVVGSTFGGGIAALVADEATAGRALDQMRALLALGGSGAGLVSREEAYGAGTLLVVTIPSEAPGAAVPEIAATVQGGVFALGTIDFVKAVVDTSEADSLARSPVYERAIARAGGNGTSNVFIDVAGIRAGITAMLPDDARVEYENEIEPFLGPIEAFASVARASGATTEVRAVITFTK